MTAYTCFSFLLKPIHIFKHTVTYFQVLSIWTCFIAYLWSLLSAWAKYFCYLSTIFSFILYAKQFPLFFPSASLHIHFSSTSIQERTGLSWACTKHGSSSWRPTVSCSLTSCWGQVIQHGEHVTKRHLSARTGPSLTVRSLKKRLRYTITHMQSK